MKIFEVKDDINIVGHWKDHYLFGKKIYTKLICIWIYE